MFRFESFRSGFPPELGFGVVGVCSPEIWVSFTWAVTSCESTTPDDAEFSERRGKSDEKLAGNFSTAFERAGNAEKGSGPKQHKRGTDKHARKTRKTMQTKEKAFFWFVLAFFAGPSSSTSASALADERGWFFPPLLRVCLAPLFTVELLWTLFENQPASPVFASARESSCWRAVSPSFLEVVLPRTCLPCFRGLSVAPASSAGTPAAAAAARDAERVCIRGRDEKWIYQVGKLAEVCQAKKESVALTSAGLGKKLWTHEAVLRDVAPARVVLDRPLNPADPPLASEQG